jgi:hypothetical protein
MHFPERKRKVDSSAVIALVGIGMIGIEAGSRMVGLLLGIAFIVLAGVLLFVRESEPPVQKHEVSGTVEHVESNRPSIYGRRRNR